ncbi:hypothetical protein [Nocardia camponoti]|uniref:Uncharacterized protein n=1 Tax=Nocardia camponoti TaxID=1616106 RepID=A0A917QT19_9NOCA|nr:hypothetical protein [Nocardia camponoti]GGK66851.1 hypothetical protein GCM10011591_43770 [Nocardia camponoti]
MARIEDALEWARQHGYEIFVHDLFEIADMFDAGCSPEQVYARVNVLEVECLLQSAIEDFEVEVNELIEEAFGGRDI